MINEPLSALNVYYDKVYVLSVKSATERRSKFTERFRSLNYEFYYGADKNNFTVEELEKNKTFSEEKTRLHHRFGKTMKPGEIACSWSHRMIYEDMLRKNYNKVLIFEDDAVPDPSVLSNIKQILNEIPSDAELVMWGWAKNGERNFSDRLKQAVYHFQHFIGRLKWNHRMISNLFAKPYSKFLKRAGFHDYTFAYAINRTGAEKLLAMQVPIQYIADNLLAHAATNKIVNAFIVYPAAFLHDNLTDGTHRDSYIR